jgi:hypothetical protein
MQLNSISEIDTTTDAVARPCLVPGLVTIHLSPDGRRIYALTDLGVQTLDAHTGLQVASLLPTRGRIRFGDHPVAENRPQPDISIAIP